VDWCEHWPAIAQFLRDDPDYPAIGLWCTSVSDDPFEGEWNEEKQASPFDWSTAFEVYSELESLKAESGATL